MRDHSRPIRKKLCAALLLPALLALGGTLHAPLAGALIVRSAGRTISYEPGPGSSPRAAARAHAGPKGAGNGKGNGKGGGKTLLLTYHQGPVMPANTNYTLFWAPDGASAYPTGFEAGIDGFFEDLAHDSGLPSNTDSILSQYTDNSGHSAAYDSHFGGALIDTDPYPANGCTAAKTCLTDAQITTELTAFVQANGLPIDLEHEYFVLTPAGVEDCKEAAGEDCSWGTPAHTYCAYHSYLEVGGKDLIYAVDPLIEGCEVGKPAGAPAYDAVIAGGLVHEHSESLTDPIVGKGWYDSDGEEVADKCRTLKASGKNSEYGTLLGEEPLPYNEVINGHRYLYQEMWSNSAEGCLQRTAELPVVSSFSPKAGPASGGNTVKITGTGFAAPASVSFGGVESGEVHVLSSTSLTAVAPAGTPLSKVKITVTTPDGTSAPSKKPYKYKSH